MTGLSIVAEEWGARILSAWQRSAEAIIVTGKLLMEAKNHVEHGEWLPMLEQIGFHNRKAQRLMEIARDERLLNPSILTLLPDRWTKIHDLHLLEDDALEEAIRKPHLIKQKRRAEREHDLGEKQAALPSTKYGVILADPEWRFEPWSRTTGMDRAADNHYPTSCTEVIAARDVPSIAADDCVLFLWATAPMLPHALLVMAAWGFDYRSHLVWYKQRHPQSPNEVFAPAIGTGYWFRNCHELLLLGVKGSVPAPAPGQQALSCGPELVGAHSQKPEFFLHLIERYFPTLPKIELNRRGPARSGWDCWGNESESAAQLTDVAALDAAPAAAVTGADSPPSSPFDDPTYMPPFLRRSVERAQ